MMNTTKMTKRNFFMAVIEMAKENDRADLVEMAEHEIALLDKKSEKKKETSDADKELMTLTLEALEGAEPMTCTQIIEIVGRPGISPSKMRAILVKCGDKVVNLKEGKKSLYKLA